MSAHGARAIPGAAVRAQKHRTCLTRKLWKNRGRAVCFKAKPSPSPPLSDGFIFLRWSSPPGLRSSSLDRGRKEEDPDSENEKLVVKEPEDEDAADETFSFKYSPGKLRGNQYKSMMTKEELEEEQRIELTSDLTSL
nr:PREDICTED: matrix-remodeling-associated protein 7 [Apteryx mantelli mantelli]